MITLLMTFFAILCFLLAISIFIQQGKGDMGLGSLGGGSQMLFGGSGGQEFFEKITWIMGVLFMVGALGISILKTTSRGDEASRLKGYTAPIETNAGQKKRPPSPVNRPKQSEDLPK